MPYLTTRKKPKATTKPWFSRLLRHPARKRSGSILVHNTHPGARTHTAVRSILFQLYFGQHWPMQQSHGLFATAKLLVLRCNWLQFDLFSGTDEVIGCKRMGLASCSQVTVISGKDSLQNGAQCVESDVKPYCSSKYFTLQHRPRCDNLNRIVSTK